MPASPGVAPMGQPDTRMAGYIHPGSGQRAGLPPGRLTSGVVPFPGTLCYHSVMTVTPFTLSPLEQLTIGDSRVTTALWEENYGPPEHRLDYLRDRFKEAGYDVKEK